MGINISGKGTLSGVASLVFGAVSQLLKTLNFGYTVSGSNINTGYYYGGSTKTVEEIVYTNTETSGEGLVGISSYPQYNKKVYRTIDFNNWQSQEISAFPYNALTGLMITPDGHIMASDGYGNRALSNNGITWTYYSGSPTYGYLRAIGNGTMVIAETSSAPIASSDNGITWSTSNGFTTDGKMDFVNGKFINHGFGINYTYSTDGLNWSSLTNIPQQMYEKDPNTPVSYYGENKFDSYVFFLNNTWIMASSAQIYYSTDFVNWNISPLWQNAGLIGNIVYLDSIQKFVIFSKNGNSYLTSSDLITSTLYTNLLGQDGNPVASPGALYSIKTIIDGTLLVFGSGGRNEAFTSLDGITWEKQITDFYGAGSDYIQNGNKIITIDDDNSFGNYSGYHPIFELTFNKTLLPNALSTTKSGVFPQDNVIFSQYSYAPGMQSANVSIITQVASTVYKTVEVPGSWIGGQGSSGSYVEQLLPVRFYDVTSSTTFDHISVQNTGQSTQYVDLGIQNLPNDGNIVWQISNYPIPAGQTVNIPYAYTLNQKTIMIDATEANTLTFKLYSI